VVSLVSLLNSVWLNKGGSHGSDKQQEKSGEKESHYQVGREEHGKVKDKRHTSSEEGDSE
jgi:hypothetical protein